jgi:hypothetical protein
MNAELRSRLVRVLSALLHEKIMMLSEVDTITGYSLDEIMEVRFNLDRGLTWDREVLCGVLSALDGYPVSIMQWAEISAKYDFTLEELTQLKSELCSMKLI